MNFQCKSCGGTRLEEIMANVTQSSEITNVGEGGDIEYGPQTAGDSGELDRYQCIDCGASVTDDENNDITDCDKLYERLEELEEERTFKISFCAQGHINQTIEIVNHKYTKEQILTALKQGVACTTVQEDGDVIIVESGEVIAKVVDVDNCLEYNEFDTLEF